jgi:hypothetical protein
MREAQQTAGFNIPVPGFYVKASTIRALAFTFFAAKIFPGSYDF